MLKRLLILIGFTTSLIVLSGAVQAATTSWIVDGTWSGSGVTGAGVSGSFNFNSDTGEYSAVDITLIDPRLLDGCSGFCSIGVDFTTPDVADESGAFFFFAISGRDDPDPSVGLQDRQLLIFDFDVALPDAISHPLDGHADYGTCVAADCDIFTTGYFLDSESFTGEISQDGVPQVPLPAAAWLFGSAVLGLMGVARRKKV